MDYFTGCLSSDTIIDIMMIIKDEWTKLFKMFYFKNRFDNLDFLIKLNKKLDVKRIANGFSHVNINQKIKELISYIYANENQALDLNKLFFAYSLLGNLNHRANQMSPFIQLGRNFININDFSELANVRQHAINKYNSDAINKHNSDVNTNHEIIQKWKNMNMILNMDDFHRNFETYVGPQYNTVLYLLQKGHAILAGGSLISMCFSLPRTKGDLDLWILDDEDEKKRENLQTVLINLGYPSHYRVFSYCNSIIQIQFKQGCPIQIIYSSYSCPEDLVSNFDMTCLEAYYDHRGFWMSPSCAYSWLTGKYYQNRQSPEEYRVEKMGFRGFLFQETNVPLETPVKKHYSTRDIEGLHRPCEYTRNIDELIKNFGYKNLTGAYDQFEMFDGTNMRCEDRDDSYIDLDVEIMDYPYHDLNRYHFMESHKEIVAVRDKKYDRQIYIGKSISKPYFKVKIEHIINIGGNKSDERTCRYICSEKNNQFDQLIQKINKSLGCNYHIGTDGDIEIYSHHFLNLKNHYILAMENFYTLKPQHQNEQVEFSATIILRANILDDHLSFRLVDLYDIDNIKYTIKSEILGV